MKDVILQLVMAFVGSLGFAMLFRLRQSLWVSASLGGVICWGGYLLAMYFSGGQIFRLGLFQRSHVISKGRITLRSRPRSGQLFADVA